MNRAIIRFVVAMASGLGLFGAFALAAEAETLRIGAQLSGTWGWELKVIKARGLDKAAGIDLQITDLANTEAGRVAMAGGSVDIILSDWLWVSRERALGRKLVFAPYSSALGAVMAKTDGPIRTLADIEGRSLGVAGGPIDKSWLMLQAYARQAGLDIAKKANVLYGAPPLLAQKAAQGEVEATLQFWNFCADLEQRGFSRVLEISEVERKLGASGRVAIVGYVFNEAYAAEHAETLAKFLAMSRQAKAALASEASLWPPIMAQIGQKDPDAALLFQKRYAEGAQRRPVADEEADAKLLFRAMASIGGVELLGPAKELDAGVYYKPNDGG